MVEKGKICGQKSKICDFAKGSKSLIQQRKIVLVGLKAQRCHFKKLHFLILDTFWKKTEMFDKDLSTKFEKIFQQNLVKKFF